MQRSNHRTLHRVRAWELGIVGITISYYSSYKLFIQIFKIENYIV